MKLYCIVKDKENKKYYNYYLDVTGRGDYVPIESKFFPDHDYSNNVNRYLLSRAAIFVDKLPDFSEPVKE